MEQLLLGKRLEMLESKLAFQEITVDKLNQTVIQHELEIIRLQEKIRQLTIMLTATAPSIISDSSEESLPPHY